MRKLILAAVCLMPIAAHATETNQQILARCQYEADRSVPRYYAGQWKLVFMGCVNIAADAKYPGTR